MNETELIQKIKELKKIKPSQDWAFQLKKEILNSPVLTLEEKPSWFSIFSFVPRHKLAFSVLTFIFVLVGVFGFAETSLPGEFLYPIKKAVERTQINLSAQAERTKLNLELANKRLSDIAKIAETNQMTKLAPAVEEFKATVAEAAKSLTQTKSPEKIVFEVQKLEEKKQKVEAMGIIIGETEELNNALFQLVEREIKDLENRSLNENQQELLEEAKEMSKAGNYSSALEIILKVSQTR